MSTLTVVLINGTHAALPIADNTLVYDGANFVDPADAKFAMLYTAFVNAKSLTFNGTTDVLQASGYNKAAVISYDSASQPSTDPSVDVQPDPSLGVCICFLTCQGTNLQYVKVVNA